MQCPWVQERLVAFADGELSPGEATWVAEHLESCDACAQLDLRLRDVTPEPGLEIPADVMERMARAVDDAVLAALDEPPAVETPTTAARWGRWLRRDRDLSNGAMLAYGILLAACVGWGVSNWLVVQELRQEVQRSPVAATAPTNSATIDSTQYEPASYQPEQREENWR
ncbi:MAG: zf-HC2 domain-containing protein [Myxococcota bacterium]